MDLEALKYPIGKYKLSVQAVTNELFEQWIGTIEKLPEELKNAVSSLSYDELELPYRPGGWNVKQVVHHLADSHMNAFIRFKLTLTEDNPTIRPYKEAEWAITEDASSEDVADSLNILEGLHMRWSTLLKSIDEEQRNRTYIHPDFNKQLTLGWMLGSYDWHSRHHLAHIKQAVKLGGDFVQ